MSAPLFNTTGSIRALMELNPALQDESPSGEPEVEQTYHPRPGRFLRLTALCIAVAWFVSMGVFSGLI